MSIDEPLVHFVSLTMDNYVQWTGPRGDCLYILQWHFTPLDGLQNPQLRLVNTPQMIPESAPEEIVVINYNDTLIISMNYTIPISTHIILYELGPSYS